MMLDLEKTKANNGILINRDENWRKMIADNMSGHAFD